MEWNFRMEDFEPVNCTIKENTNEQSLILDCRKDGGGLHIKGIPGQLGNLDWKNAKYIVVDAINHESWVLGVTFLFWKQENKGNAPDLGVTMGLIPGVKTRLVLPLEALNSQKMFLERTPGKLKTVVFGNKVDLDEVDRFAIGAMRCFEEQRLEISNLRLSDVEPDYPLPDVKLVDEFGQLINRDWPGKTKSEDELKARLRMELTQSANPSFFEGWSRYGGWKEKRFEATGYFRTHYDGERWWLVDPDGYAFYSNGMDCVGPQVSGYIQGIETFFEWLPEKEGPYAEAWGNRGRTRFFDFATANLIRVFGKEWWDNWAKITKKRLMDWGINTIGNWSSLEFIRYAKMPYVWPLAGFPDTEKKVFRDFPDVFSQEYQENANRFAEQLKSFEVDPYLIGYFLRNEPQWAFIGDLNIAEELLENENQLASKNALIEFLSKRYDGDIQKFNQAWNLSFTRFEELNRKIKKASRLSAQAAKDLDEFSRLMIEAYVKIPSQAARKVDPHHMNLGMRYAYISNPNLLAGYENFDVFSINCYKITPVDDIERLGSIINMPVMIGEFHHGALDRGLPATGIRGVRNQEERGKAYRYYMESGAESKYSVGAHHFTLNDQPGLGRFDGENFQIGCVDICQRPYDEFVQGMIEAHKGIYEVADGRKKKTEILPEEIDRVGF